MDMGDIRGLDYGGIGRLVGSRTFVAPGEVIAPLKDSPAILEIVALIATGPKNKTELAKALGITENAVCKRIFRARKAGYVIKLNTMGLYWMASNERTCRKCGKKLAKLNRSDCCYNCSMED